MSIASIHTSVSLDNYSRIMGINPVHFNGGNQIQLADGRILFPLNNAQNNIWCQQAWQNSDQVSREELCQCLYDAEVEVERFLGYHICPKWIENEQIDLPTSFRHDIPGIQHDSRDGFPQIELKMKKFIAGGRRKATLLGNVSVSYDDNDSDGWDESVSLNLDVSSLQYTAWDLKNIKVYFEGQFANPEFEIRDCKKVYIDGAGILHMYFDSWLFVDYELQETFPTNDRGGKSIDFTDTDSFVSNVDIYYVYNDDTQNQVEFIYLDSTNTEYVHGGFLQQQRFDANYVIPVAATYSSGWVADCITYNYKKCELFYYSGNNYKRNIGYNATCMLDPYLAQIISYIATARLPRIFYANNNATSLAEELRVDLNKKTSNTRYPIKDIIDNPFGTHEGEVRAWRKLQKFCGNRLAFALI